jgi:putative phage-type endonuclease
VESFKNQRSKEWLEYRKDKIGASDAPIIMGISPWKNVTELWKEKKNITPAPFVTEKMREGIKLEEEAIIFAEKQTGLLFFPDVVAHDKYDRIIASLDGIDLDRKVICECKCSAKYYDMGVSGNIYPDIICQIQHQMMCTGLDNAILCCYYSKKGKIVEIKRDDEFIDSMLEKELKFLEILDGDISPESRQDCFMKVEVSQMEKYLIEEWMKKSQQLKQIQEEEKHLKSQILDLGDDGDVILTYENQNLLKMQRVNREGMVDWKALCKAKGISEKEIDSFRKEGIGFYQIKQM